MPEITSKSNITAKDALDFHKNGKPGKLQISATKPLATARDLSNISSSDNFDLNILNTL